MIKLDLKHFKHKESGDDCTTLVHKDGHLFTLSHSKLSKEHRAQLEALRDATKSKKDSGHNENGQQMSDKKLEQEPSSVEEKPIKMAEGGRVPYKLDKPEDITEESLIPTQSDMPKAAESSTADFLPSTVLKPAEAEPVPVQPETPAMPKPADFVSQKAGSEGLNQYTRLDEPQKQEYLKKIGYGVSQNETSPQPIAAPQNPIAPAAMEQPQEPIQSPSAQAVPQANANTTSQPQQPIVEPPAPKPSDEYLSQVDAVKHDFDMGYITPKTYSSMFSNQSTLGKIGTIFGLLVSGAGAGMSRQPNMLMDMMDKEIQRDLDAQKSKKSNQMDFMKLAEQQVMNQANISHMRAEDKIKANALAQQYAYMSAYDKLARQAQSMPEGPAKVNALNALAGIAKGIQDKALMTGSMLDTQYEAMKRSPHMGKATEAQEVVDKEFAKDYAEFAGKGAVNTKNSLNKMKLLVNEIKKDTGFGEAGGGRSAAILPDTLRSRDAIRRRDQARNLANSTLKELFGGQLSDAEREAAAREYYNDALDNKENAKILDSKIQELQGQYENKLAQAKYYEKNGTLRGFKGSEAKAAENPTVMKNGVEYRFDPDRNGYVKVK